MPKYPRIQLDEHHAAAVRYLSGPHVHLGEVGKKSTVITILRLGSFSHPVYGRFEITRELLQGMVDNFDRKTYGQEIFMDVGHRPQDGSAGDIKRLFIEGNRLRANVEWTDHGLDAIKTRGFRYISADFIENWKDNEHEKEHGPVLFGAALVTRPHIKNMDPVQLAEHDGQQHITLLHHRTLAQLKTEEQNMKKLLAELKAKFQSLKLADAIFQPLLAAFEDAGKQLADNEAGLKALYDQFETVGIQLAEKIAGQDPGKPINIQLGDISLANDPAAIDKLVTKRLEAIEADKAKKLADAATAQAANQKVYDDALADAKGLSEGTIKTLNEARELITGSMTPEQVKAMAAQQIKLGNELEASKQLAAMGYQVPGAAGNVHIQMGDGAAPLKLQEHINKGLKSTSAGQHLRLAADDKMHPFVAEALAVFDRTHARQLHEESKQLANGQVDIASTNLPVGFQRTVIREALSDLRVLELVNAMTDPTAQATTQIPYEVRDTSQILNDGITYEGQGIRPAGIEQKMDLAYIVPVKLSLKISNEVMHFSLASGINWNAYARNVESNARVMRELIARRICNTLQRAADSYLSVAVAAEAFDSQAGKASGIIKTANFPILRPHQDRDLQGTAIGSEVNPITVVLNGTTLTAYDGSGTQSAGTYYYVSNYNLGYIQLCDEAGTAVAIPADTGTNTVSYTRATNIKLFDLDIPSGDRLEQHMNGLLQAIGSRKAVMSGQRFVMPDFLLMSPTLNDSCTNAENFTSAAKREDVNMTAQGDLTGVKGIGAWSTNAPSIDLGDDRILMGQRGTLGYTIAKAFSTGQPFEAVDANGLPTGQKVAYGEEYSAMKVPSAIQNRLTSVIAYSVTGRAAV